MKSFLCFFTARAVPRERPKQFAKVSRTALLWMLCAAAAFVSFHCSSGEMPLSVHMYNPKTHQALTCSARDQRGGSDASLLANAVENCARSLEARGFIREK